MSDQAEFASLVREHYPEGLTAVMPVGGTRTMYILEKNRHKENPGHIANFFDHADYLEERYFALIDLFFELGGHNIIIPIMAYDRFTIYGEKYAELLSEVTFMLIGEKALAAYRAHGADPYFLGTDTLIKLPAEHPGHRLGVALREFQEKWDYKEGNRKILWEIAGMPLYSLWNTHNLTPDEQQEALRDEMDATSDPEKIRQMMYNYYSRSLYGTKLPMPDFYLGCTRNGDLKIGSALSTSLTWGFMCRMYFVPYPTMFLTRETLKTIIEDLTFGKLFRSRTADYQNRYTPELAEAEWQRILELRANPQTTLGLTRQVLVDTDDD
jgi:hypothetical protein